MKGTRAFIVGFILVQILLPASYYTCGDYKHDERFAWRMFSSHRTDRCAVDLRVNGKPVQLARFSTQFHMSVWTLLSRGRLDVANAVRDHICDMKEPKLRRMGVSGNAEQVTLTMQCIPTIEKSSRPAITYSVEDNQCR